MDGLFRRPDRVPGGDDVRGQYDTLRPPSSSWTGGPGSPAGSLATSPSWVGSSRGPSWPGTFSKRLGGQGGFVAGSWKLIDYLRGFSRSRFFSCALAPTVTAGLIRALELAESEPELRAKLFENVDFMQKKLRGAGVDIADSDSQVIPIMIRVLERNGILG